ncbi:MAG: tetratricopeptide repeat protein, partial [Myxococcaceae bacterium]|nr:tetratricopeptide repeat protein [Myxococcaceae bacterium]
MAKCPKCQYDNAEVALMCNLCGLVLRRASSNAPARTAQPPSTPAARFDFQELASRQVKALEPFGVALDFSPASLLAIDAFLDDAGGARAPGATDWQPTQAQNAVIVGAGAYFGEVIRRCLGGQWVQPDDDNLAGAKLDFPALTLQPFRAGFLRLRDGDRAGLHAAYESCRSALGVTGVPLDTLPSYLAQADGFLQKHRPDLAQRFVDRAKRGWPQSPQLKALEARLAAAHAEVRAAEAAAVATPATAPAEPGGAKVPAAAAVPPPKPAPAPMQGVRALRYELAGALKRRDFASALGAVDRLLVEVPGERGALIDRGLALAGLGRIDDAVHALERAIAAFPDDLEAYDARQQVLLDAGRLAEALAANDAILARAPGRTPTLRMRAGVLMRLGEKDRALEAITRAVERSPDEAASWVLRGTIEGKLLRTEQAREALRRAIALAAGKDDEALAVARRELQQLEALTPMMDIDDASGRQDPTQLALA